MAQKRLSMRKIREALRLKNERGLSNRQIAASLKVSHNTVAEYLRRVGEAGLKWPIGEALDDERLEALLFPPPRPSGTLRPVPDWAWVQLELVGAEREGVPLIYSRPGERNENIAVKHVPVDPGEGVFLIIVGRAPRNVWDVEHTADAWRIRNIKRKEPRSWVNHYAFHIMDREWGHVIIRFCPHPPFKRAGHPERPRMGRNWGNSAGGRVHEGGQLLYGALRRLQRPGPGPCRRNLEFFRELYSAPG